MASLYRTFTFWRFLIQVPLGPHEMAITYSINSGQRLEFFVPGRTQNMRWAAHSVSLPSRPSRSVTEGGTSAMGFQLVSIQMIFVDQDSSQVMTLSGSTCCINMRKNLSMHLLAAETSCIAIGLSLPLLEVSCFSRVGILSSFRSLMRERELQGWVAMKPDQRKAQPLTEEIAATVDRFYFTHYCQAFRRGAFARANSSMYIPPFIFFHILTVAQFSASTVQTDDEHVW